MTQVIILDAGPLGLITNPKLSPESESCNRWLQTHITSGSRIIIPEISDYEIRRELLRANKTKGISRLDNLAELLEYLPITTIAMRQVTKLWAGARMIELQVRRPHLLIRNVLNILSVCCKDYP